jgi:hypothetical protein
VEFRGEPYENAKYSATLDALGSPQFEAAFAPQRSFRTHGFSARNPPAGST